VILGVVTTVNATPLLTTPLAPTTTFPDVAPVGIGVAIDVLLQLVGVALVPLNSTLPPCIVPKLLPVIVTVVIPIVPEEGEILEIDGGGTTVKVTPLLLVPFTVANKLPVVAPAGTWTTKLVAVKL
jgi:hypothetical protein